ncbi:MAG: EscU/YscU/HrcU family type III secretion system export apparatus switch protein [Gammaproteobacteria bacterium]|nr:EscU/YscU/HrcU family type III secretion system export apparatus switch protein [Gammaproteobacteria bacterium]
MKFKKQQSIAVALEYDGFNAPRVTAKGIGEVAEKILRLAKQQGIPLQQDIELVEILSQIDLGDEIPENLYHAIAEVIAFAYIISGKFPENFNPDSY